MPADGVIRIARERRRASMASIIHGLDEREADAVAKTLKRLCGTGGTSKNGVVEIDAALVFAVTLRSEPDLGRRDLAGIEALILAKQMEQAFAEQAGDEQESVANDRYRQVF